MRASGWAWRWDCLGRLPVGCTPRHRQKRWREFVTVHLSHQGAPSCGIRKNSEGAALPKWVRGSRSQRIKPIIVNETTLRLPDRPTSHHLCVTGICCLHLLLLTKTQTVPCFWLESLFQGEQPGSSPVNFLQLLPHRPRSHFREMPKTGVWEFLLLMKDRACTSKRKVLGTPRAH